MAAIPADLVTQANQFYTPNNVRKILKRGEAHMERGAMAAMDDLRTHQPSKRPVHTSWDEARIIEHADVFGQLQHLPWLTRQIVQRYYVASESAKHIATVLRCDRETVTRHAVDGSELIAFRLGWRGKRTNTPARPAAARGIYRSPRLEDDVEPLSGK